MTERGVCFGVVPCLPFLGFGRSPKPMPGSLGDKPKWSLVAMRRVRNLSPWWDLDLQHCRSLSRSIQSTLWVLHIEQDPKRSQIAGSRLLMSLNTNHHKATVLFVEESLFGGPYSFDTSLLRVVQASPFACEGQLALWDPRWRCLLFIEGS